jgi:diguanylate cyclase (GGDEF)-like protein
MGDAVINSDAISKTAGVFDETAVPVLLEVLDALTLESDFDAFFARAAGAIASLLGADGAALMRLSDDGSTLEYQLFEGEPASVLKPFVGHRFPSSEGTAGRALRERRTIHIADYPASPEALSEPVAAGLRSNIVIPLRTANQPVGVLAASWFNRAQATPPAPERLALVERIAGQIAVACYRNALEGRLRALALTDPLTGLESRRGIMAALDEKQSLHARYGRRFTVFLLDLDGFKQANDIGGHALGDDLLRDAANRMRDATRRGDHIGRLGGDEFLVVAECRAEEVASVAQRLLQAVNVSYGDGRLSASVGIATCPRDGTDAATLLRRADIAMYESKRRGSGSYRHFDQAMENDSGHQHALTPDVADAIKDRRPE